MHRLSVLWNVYLVRPPFWLKWLYPQAIWHQSRSEKSVYLTFDDGPIPVVTPFVLKTLADFQAKATFFCIGNNVQKHPQIFQQILQEGHGIGNHTFDHLKGLRHSDQAYLENIRKAADVIPSGLFRPPYGKAKPSQIRQLSRTYRIIMWDVLSWDFDAQTSVEKCVANVKKHTQNGSIIVFHDSEKAWPRLEKALPELLGWLQSEGYQFRALPA